MSRFPFALLCAILVLSSLDSVISKRYGYSGSRSGGHHYPSSHGGLSGSGSSKHTYPGSSGLSGGGRGYPSQSHGYPSQSQNHGYPGSSGLSGAGKSNPTSNTHGGSHGYPSGTGLSGNSHGRTTIINNYHYSPPQRITYPAAGGGPPVHYPVYQGQPPAYVYQYKDSGSKYGTLLAGLALLNLGSLGANAYLAHKVSQTYKPEAGEVCKFGVKKNNDYEETAIDCSLISSFIFQQQMQTQNQPTGTNTTITTTTVTNVTTLNGEPAAETPNENRKYEMLPNGTMVLIPQNTTVNGTSTNTTSDGTANNTMTSSVVTTTNTTTVTNALDVKGSPVQVTPGMECYVIRTSRTSNLRKAVPCGLLQTYADKSIKRNSATRTAPALTILALVVTAFTMY